MLGSSGQPGETLTVGTRMARPSSLPFQGWQYQADGFAAPVFSRNHVFFPRPLRARRRSLWRTSSHGLVSWSARGWFITPFYDTDVFVQHFGYRCQAVGGARRVGIASHVAGNHVVVYAVNDGCVNVIAAGSEISTFRAAFQVDFGFLCW